MPYLLDTHAAVWLLEGSAKFGPRARAAIERESSVSISDVSLLEIALLSQRGVIVLRPNLSAGLKGFAEKLVVLPINAEIAADAVRVPLPHRDPFDRVIAATARVNGLVLITRDRQITDASVVETLW
jgi:PIN domain nuclease of toxin-antitoxin system